MPSRRTPILLGLLLLAIAAGPALAAKGYLRTPDLHGDRVVFVAEGDLWLCSDRGGLARRLTTHVGAESYPRFSPDGKWIAFTGFYDGNRDVFVMPVEGGEPRRLTWHPASDEVIEWTPDGKHLIFRSWRNSPHFNWELYQVPVKGGDPEKLPLGWAARIDVDPDSGRWAFNRISRETRTWKRYRGGTAANIWVGDPRKADFKRVTDFDGTDAHPMWHKGRVWFVSDKGGTYNLWSMKPDGTDRKRHTDTGDWDVRFPGMGPDGRIAYMLAGGISIYDPARDRSSELDIDLPSERNLVRERTTDPVGNLTWFDLSPDGERVAIVTRGEIYSVPVEDGVTLPVSRGSGAREDYALYGPKGERLFYLSDGEGEEAFYTADAWGRGDVKTVKKPVKTGFHFPPAWSPDGKWIAYGFNDYGLYVLDAESGGAPRLVDKSTQWHITDYAWSHDGRWLAYTKLAANDFGQIHIYDTESGESRAVTGAYTDDRSPAWDPDGKYLYFLSSRNMNPLLGSRDFTAVEFKNAKPYLVILQADGENPFAKLAGLPPEDDGEDGEDGDEDGDKDEDEDEDEDKEGDGDEDKDEEDEEKLEPVEIDFDGLAGRVLEISVPVGRYTSLGAVSGKLLYLSWAVRGWSEGPDWMEEARPENDLMAFDLESEEADSWASGVYAYELTPKADKMAIMTGPGEIHVVDASGSPDLDGDNLVSLDGVVVELEPAAEWRQIYHEAWRRMRDRYWDADMAGLDWKGLRDHYAKLLPLLANRSDLGDLIGELIGELATGHTYVWGGDPAVRVPRRNVGLLGADLVRDGDAYRIARIYRGDDADNERSPLDEPGVDVAEGDFILAVNRQPVPADRPFHALMQSLAGKEVLLTVAADRRGKDEKRDVVVTPMGIDNSLRYADWVRGNRELVTEKTGGKIGYVHVPDMGRSGMIEWNTWFYSQLDKEGLVVDMRWNGGGFVSSMLVERLRRPITAFNRTRQGRVDTYPEVNLNGPFVVLTNEFAGSDGDIFPRAVQLEKLAPVIGMRSWGGVIGINILKTMVDGGIVTYPFAAWWDAEWGWGLENRGVVPDIEVQNLPQELAENRDAQLDRGIAEVLELHRRTPPIRPDFGKEPAKTRRAFSGEN